VLQRREARDPDAVDRAEHDEGGDESPMRAGQTYARARYRPFTRARQETKVWYLVPNC
jgi:hypothetical protein